VLGLWEGASYLNRLCDFVENIWISYLWYLRGDDWSKFVGYVVAMLN